MSRPAPPPRVSVCVPSYNHVRFVRACIESVLEQSFADFEVVVQDDCSDDGTWECLREVNDPRVLPERNDRRLGITANWNRSVTRSRGEFVVMLPSDDMLAPMHLSTLVDLMDSSPGVAFIGTAVEYIHPQGQSCGERYRRGMGKGRFRVTPGRSRLKHYAFATKVMFSGTMFRRRCYEAVGGFNEAMIICEDWDFWVRCLMVGDEGFYNDKLVRFRWHSANTSGIPHNRRLHYLEAMAIQRGIWRYSASLVDRLFVLLARAGLVLRAFRDPLMKGRRMEVVREALNRRASAQ